MALRLQKKLDVCRSDETIRCILITGDGKAFCAGQDLKEAIDPKGPEIKEILLLFEIFIPLQFITLLFINKILQP